MRKQTHEIKIRLTAEELADLNAKVKDTLYSREEFCRCAITGMEVKQAPTADIPILIRDIRRASFSLDRLFRKVNSGHLINDSQVQEVLKQTYLAADAIVKAYTT